MFESMIFFMEQKREPCPEFHWIPCFIETLEPRHFKNFKFRINGVVYNTYSKEFVEAHNADKMWDQLLYREPTDD